MLTLTGAIEPPLHRIHSCILPTKAVQTNAAPVCCTTVALVSTGFPFFSRVIVVPQVLNNRRRPGYFYFFICFLEGSSSRATERNFFTGQKKLAVSRYTTWCGKEKSSYPVEFSHIHWSNLLLHKIFIYIYISSLTLLAFLSTWTSWKSVPPEVRHGSPAHCLSNANAQLFLAPPPTHLSL